MPPKLIWIFVAVPKGVGRARDRSLKTPTQFIQYFPQTFGIYHLTSILENSKNTFLNVGPLLGSAFIGEY